MQEGDDIGRMRFGEEDDPNQGREDDCRQSMLAKTKAKDAYPTGTNVWFWVEKHVLLGSPIEGEAADPQPTGIHFYALNQGTHRPPPGTFVEIIPTDGGLVFFHYE